MEGVLTPALEKAGVKMLAGTDAEGLGTIAGFSLIDDLKLLHESGLTNFEALQTATSYPALFVGQERAFGSIVRGSRADLILLTDNPLANLENLRGTAGVFVAGKWLTRNTLERFLEQVPQRYNQQLHVAMQLLVENKAEDLFRFLDFNDPYQRMSAFLLASLFKKHDFSTFTATVEKLRQHFPDTALTSERAITSYIANDEPQLALAAYRGVEG